MLSYLCSNCKNYKTEYSCKAFKKIPKSIFLGFKPHNKPLPGQENKIVFEPLKNA